MNVIELNIEISFQIIFVTFISKKLVQKTRKIASNSFLVKTSMNARKLSNNFFAGKC